MFLARKISEAKWRTSQEPEWSDGEIPADAVTIDLKTRENTLSFWRCGDGSDSEVEEAALAMAASGDHIETVVIVWLSEEDLESAGLRLAASEGETTIEDLVSRHVDTLHLDYVRLGEVARFVASAIAEGRLRRIKRKNVKGLLLRALRDGRARLDDFEDRVREELRKAL